jgi:hypothetical protein
MEFGLACEPNFGGIVHDKSSYPEVNFFFYPAPHQIAILSIAEFHHLLDFIVSFSFSIKLA